MNDLLCVIPARKNSRRLPDKNMKMIGNMPMVGRAIKRAQDSGIFDEVLLTSDCEDCIAVAEGLGDVTIVRRRPDLCTDDVGLIPVFMDAVKSVLNMRCEMYKYGCLFTPTQFLVPDEYLQKAFDVLRGYDPESPVRYDPIGSVLTHDHKFPWFYYLDRGATICRVMYLTMRDTQNYVSVDINTEVDLDLARRIDQWQKERKHH